MAAACRFRTGLLHPFNGVDRGFVIHGTHRRKRRILLVFTCFLVCQNILKLNSTMRSRLLEGHSSGIKNLDESRSGYPKQFGCLLSGERERAWHDGDRQTTSHRIYGLNENLVDLMGDFDLVARFSPGKEELGRRIKTPARCMSFDEAVNLSGLWSFWREEGFLGGCAMTQGSHLLVMVFAFVSFAFIILVPPGAHRPDLLRTRGTPRRLPKIAP